MNRNDPCGPGDWWWASRAFRGPGFGFRGPGGRGRQFWADAFGETPPRAERGEVRYLVLEAIAAQPRHGYEIIQHIEQRSGGAYRPSPGVVYPTLQMLEELEQAQVVEQEGRKVYTITDAGRADLDANAALVTEFYARFEDDPWETYAQDFGELMKSVARLVQMFRRHARHGRIPPRTLRAVRLALDEALRKIEEALGGSER